MAHVCPTCGLPRTPSEMQEQLQEKMERGLPVSEYNWCACVDQTPEARRSRLDVLLEDAMEDDEDGDDADEEDR